jgi:hypothetical protein
MAPQLAEGANGGSAGKARSLRAFEEPACGQQCAQKLFERYLAGEAMSRQHYGEPVHNQTSG